MPVPVAMPASAKTEARSNKVTRTGEMVVGIVGGIFGFLVGVFELFISGLGKVFGVAGAAGVAELSTLTFFASTVGIIAAAVVGMKPRLSGAFMILAAVLGLIGASMFYAIPAILLGVGGLLALIRKERPIETPMPPSPRASSYCMKCGKPWIYVPQYGKWYCETCKIYA